MKHTHTQTLYFDYQLHSFVLKRRFHAWSGITVLPFAYIFEGVQFIPSNDLSNT